LNYGKMNIMVTNLLKSAVLLARILTGKRTEQQTGSNDGVGKKMPTSEKRSPRKSPEIERGGTRAEVDIVQKMDMWEPMVRLKLIDYIPPSKYSEEDTLECEIWLTKYQAYMLADELMWKAQEINGISRRSR
jgi:hypothetical protein